MFLPNLTLNSKLFTQNVMFHERILIKSSYFHLNSRLKGENQLLNLEVFSDLPREIYCSESFGKVTHVTY